MEFWYVNGTPLSDAALESAKLRCFLAERRLNEALTPMDVSEAIYELNAAESEFNRRLIEIRRLFFYYGVLDSRAARREKRRRHAGRRRRVATG